MKRTAVSYVQGTDRRIRLFPEPMQALQWVDAENPREASEMGRGTVVGDTRREVASALLEGRRTSIYYKGCDITTLIEESK